MQEDHVSLGWHAARKLRTAVENLRRVLAIELLAATRAIDLRAENPGEARGRAGQKEAAGVDGTPLPPAHPGPVAAAVIAELRKTVAGPAQDRFLTPDIAGCEEFIASGALAQVVRSTGLELRRVDEVNGHDGRPRTS